MAEAKHKPGPWVVYRDNPRNEGIAYISGSNRSFGVEVAVVYGNSQADRANARLIAAAPELLEVARLLALATDEGDDAAQGTHYIDKAGRIRCKGSFLDTVEKARAAIAKATGEASHG